MFARRAIFLGMRIVEVPVLILSILGGVACYPMREAPVVGPPPMFGDYKVQEPLIEARRGAFKITENESPQPKNRVYVNYNYYRNIKRDVVPGKESIHRETFGFEKLLNDDVSFGMRLPFFQGIDGYDFKVADLSLLLKYAPVWNRNTGSGLSVGLVLTPPTGQIPSRLDVATGKSIHATLLQPFAGYAWNGNDFFLTTFHSVMVPTTSDDASILFNSVAVGDRLYRAPPDRFLTGVIPTLELHVNTPFNHRAPGPLQVYRDHTDLTGGVHFEFRQRYLIGTALDYPVTTPRGRDWEAIASFNVRY